jgi:hypothetical protein
MTKKNAREKKDGDYTHITVVLDRSGSMHSLKPDTMGGFNQFLDDQQKMDGKGTFTMVQFADTYRIQDDMAPLENAKALTEETYDPSGPSTSLLDAIGRTINHVESKLKGMEEGPDKVLFVIITDGQENSSKEFKRDHIMEMIKRHEDENDWDFVFIGANQDAIQEGGSMGVRATNAYTYDASQLGTKCLYSALSKSTRNYRRAKKVSGEKLAFFDDADKKEQEDLLNK